MKMKMKKLKSNRGYGKTYRLISRTIHLTSKLNSNIKRFIAKGVLILGMFYVEGVNLHKGLQENNLLLFSCDSNWVSHEKERTKGV
jgi:hypothetical protein